MPRPDAVMLPETIKKGDSQVARIRSVLALAEPLLEVVRPKEKAHIRRQPNGVMFITRDPKDTLFHPFGTDKEGQPRYEWESVALPGVSGDVQVGRLIDRPESEIEPEPSPAAAPEPIPAPAEEPKS
jgi:hypothetical protein